MEGFSTAEVARRAGCSVQHVRDLASLGVLPPVERAPNGYRRYTSAHVSALLAYRALSRALGPVDAKRIMLLASWREVLVALDEAHARLHAERLALERARVAASVISSEPMDAPVPGDAMSISELAGALGVRASALRHWESEGLLHPGRVAGAVRVYSPADVRDARIADQLRRAGHRIAELRGLLDEVRRLGVGVDVERALGVRAKELDRRSGALVEAGSLLRAQRV